MKAIRKAIRHLDPKLLAQSLPEPLTEQNVNDLLVLADETLVKEITKIAIRISTARPAEIPSIAASHRQHMLNYFWVRSVLCGDSTTKDEEPPDLAIF
jgi:hypothetical protein